MLSLTRKVDYALVAMADLACREPARVSAREIAERSRLPLPALTNILKRLTHEGLVTATRGSHGGYRLARGAAQISLAELIHAVDSPIRLARCCHHDDDGGDFNGCDKEDICRIKGPVQRVHQSLRAFLGQVTLAHIAWDIVPLGITISEVGAAVTPGRFVSAPGPGLDGGAAGQGADQR